MRTATSLAVVGLLLAGCSSSGQEASPAEDSTVPAVASSATTDTTEEATSTLQPETTTGRAPPASCDPQGEGLEIEADVDGDGSDDVVFVAGGPGAESVLMMCDRSSNELVVGGGNKPLDFHVVDIEGDGIEELIVGGPFGAGRFAGEVVRFTDSAWAFDRTSVRVVYGELGQPGESFGCVDLTGDGRTELVTLRYQLDADRLDDASSVSWQRFVAGQETATPEAEGTFDVASDRDAIETLIRGTCGDQIVIEG